MTFGQALEATRVGKCVCRTGWNGKDMWIALRIPDSDDRMTRPYLYMRDAQGKVVPWAVSQTDVLTDDWEICV